MVYQQLENSVIQPRIQSRAVDVNAFAIIVAVLFGSTLFGIVGALLAVPSAATLQILGREYMQYRRDMSAREIVEPALAGRGARAYAPPSTRTTSASEVTPARTFSRPSSRRRIMPSAHAASAICEVGARWSTSARSGSFIAMTS